MTEKPTYSFSRATTWGTCEYSFKRNYIEGDRGEDNFFNTFGSLGHDIFEKVDKGLIRPEEAFHEWTSRYDTEVVAHTEKWMDNWKRDGDNFFKQFTGWRTVPIWIEEHFTLDMGSYNFQGYVDRLGKAPNGDLILTDYKCAKPYEGTNLKEKARQLYLYSKAVHEKFGEWPKKLIFFHFRQNLPLIIPFNANGLAEAVEWADRTVADIQRYQGDYPMRDNGYFCQAVCGYRKSCAKQFVK